MFFWFHPGTGSGFIPSDAGLKRFQVIELELESSHVVQFAPRVHMLMYVCLVNEDTR